MLNARSKTYTAFGSDYDEPFVFFNPKHAIPYVERGAYPLWSFPWWSRTPDGELHCQR